jgi:hypothetical protein
MAQVDQQQPQQQEQSFEDPSMQDPSMQEQQLAMADEDVMAMGDPNQGMARYGREIDMYQEGKEKPVNPLPKDHPQYAEVQKDLDSGEFELVKGDVVNGKQQYSLKKIAKLDPKFEAERNTQLGKQKTTGQNQKGTGSVSIYGEDIAGQEKAFQENPKGIYQYGRLSQGTRPELQGEVNGVFGSADIKTPESKADFMDRWGDVVATIPGFDYDKDGKDPQWGEFQKKAEETRKKEHIAAFGSDKGYVPYWKQKGTKGYKPGEDFDSRLGLHTYNAPRFKVGEAEPADRTFGVDIPEKEKTFEIPPVNKYTPPEGQWWRQDENNLQALGLIDDNLYLPWAPDAGPAKIDYVLNDWRGRANAALSSQNTMAGALAGAGGVQAVASSNIQGTALDDIAQNIDRVNMSNVGIMNQVAPMQAQLNMKVDDVNQARNMAVYDNTQKTLQNHDNFLNWKIGKQAELENTALTNRANTYNLNTLYDNYAIDPTTGGPIGFKGNKAFQKVKPQGDRQEQFLNDYTKLKKNLPADTKVDEWFAKMYFGLGANETPDMTNYQAELKRNGLPQAGPLSQGKSGKEIKKMIVPFYTGKMGA